VIKTAEQRHSSFIYQYSKPNQPNSVNEIPKQKLSKRVLIFQSSWFKDFPWLHYSPQLQSVLCFHCAKADSLGYLKLASKPDGAFISTGFSNWKKAIEKFSAHESSHTHSYAVSQLQQCKTAPVIAQVSKQKEKQQQDARKALLKMLSSLKYLARQGLAIRGHETDTGNYYQLVKLRSDDVPELQTWLQKTTNFMSSDIQNEMLTLLANNVVHQLVETIRNESQQFAIILDGTQDCSGMEQESLCVRYVDLNLQVHEVFLDLFEPSDTCGGTLARTIEESLMRLGLSIDEVRAQTYDGASNMSGEYKGCQAIIRGKHPLASWFHCGAHCANLVAQSAASSIEQLRDAMACVHELGVLHARSIKYRAVFREIATSGEGKFTTLKPMCPTRWLCRARALESALDQYESVLESLSDMSQGGNGDVATKANGLLYQFQKCHTMLLLNMALKVFSLLEQLNRCLQAKTATISGMVDAVRVVKSQLESMRTTQAFDTLFNASLEAAKRLDLDELEVPRKRRPPARYTGPAEAHGPPTAKERYRVLYYQLIDTTVMQLGERFDTASSGISTYIRLESVLLDGEVTAHEELISGYPELDVNTLSTQLGMFHSQWKYNNLSGAVEVIQAMSEDVHRLFPQVDRLVRLMLICPVSSCEAERSFSSLRRLKTWLRNSMTQSRLNAIAVCHAHQDVLDAVDLERLAEEFISRSNTRKMAFGHGAFK